MPLTLTFGRVTAPTSLEPQPVDRITGATPSDILEAWRTRPWMFLDPDYFRVWLTEGLDITLPASDEDILHAVVDANPDWLTLSGDVSPLARAAA